MDASEDLIADLQVRLTFLDEAVDSLIAADADLARRVATLEQAVRVLRGEVRALRAAGNDDPALEPPPPHY